MPTSIINIGDTRLLALCDTTIQIELKDLFPGIPDESWQPYRRLYPNLFAGRGGYNLAYTCYLLRSQGKTILVDTGIGPTDSPICVFFKIEGHLLEKLQSEGVEPDEVDMVVLTHLHPDHVGWNTVMKDDLRSPTFPRARYIAHKADWDAFSQVKIQSLFEYSFFDECMKPLESEGRLDLISEDSSITGETELIHTPGHTPGSMSVLVSSGDNRAIIWADVTAHPAQLAEPDWDYAFDMDKETARNTRRRLVDHAIAEGMTVAATHFFGFWRHAQLEGRDHWQAL